MSDSTAPTEPSPTGAKPRRVRARTLLIAGGLFLLGLAGGGVMMIGPDRLIGMVTGTQTATPLSDGAPSEPATRGAETETEAGGSTVFLMEDHIVNLVTGSGPSTRFARVRVAVVYNPTLMPIGTLQEKKPFLRDAFHGFLSQLTERDLDRKSVV